MRYKLLGTEEGFSICEFCHKKEISNLFHVEDTETGKTHVFGSSCILKALNIPDSEFKIMKSEKELSELETLNAHFNLEVQKELYYGKLHSRVYISFNGERYTRLINEQNESKAVCSIGYYKNCKTGEILKFDTKNENRKQLLKYFSTKKKLLEIVKGKSLVLV